MIFDALAQYAQSLAAFWVSLASGGFLKMLMIWGIIYWIFCRRGRRRRWRARWGQGGGCCSGMGGDRWDAGCGCGCSCGGCAHCDCTCGGCACQRTEHAPDQAAQPPEGGADV